MKKEYTIAIHVSRLKKMLKQNNPCGLCPVGRKFKYDPLDILERWGGYEPGIISKPCWVCMDFVKAGECPCTYFGKSEALKLTHLAIEKYEDENKEDS